MVALLRRFAGVSRWASAVGVLVLLTLPAVAAGALRPPPAPAPPHRAPRRVAPPPVSTPVADPAMHVLFVGASITTGMEQSSLDTTFPGLVVAGLRKDGAPVDWGERAQWGATVGDALTWPYPSDQQVIIVHLITNDFAKGTALATYQSQLHRVLLDLRSRSPQAKLVCLGNWSEPGALDSAQLSQVDYDTVAQALCDEQGGQFVPLAPIFADPASRGPAGLPTPWGPTDDFHPNDAGAQRIADAVLAAIPPAAKPS